MRLMIDIDREHHSVVAKSVQPLSTPFVRTRAEMRASDVYRYSFPANEFCVYHIDQHTLLLYQQRVWDSVDEDWLYTHERPLDTGDLRYISKTRHGLYLCEQVPDAEFVWRVANAPLRSNEVDLSAGEYTITRPIHIVAAPDAIGDLAEVINHLAYEYRMPVTVELRNTDQTEYSEEQKQK